MASALVLGGMVYTGVTAAAAAVAPYAALAAAGASVYGGISAYQASKDEAKSYKDAGKAAEQEATAKAAEYNRQAAIEDTRAGLEQLSGEREAEKRSRQLAQDVGSMYANFAGNGLMLDGSSKDVVGSALRTQTAEAAFDIATTNSNTAMNVWTRRANAASLRASAANSIIAGQNQRTVYNSKAKSARKSGVTSLATGLASAAGSLATAAKAS